MKDPKRMPAQMLNPEAGSHRVTGDPLEVDAARRASARTWAAFPYFAARYGERGKRFGDSDAGWLVTLSELPQGEASEQVSWLGSVLSSRGMPQITLEHQLRTLHEELVAAVPDNRKRYDMLLACAVDLERSRTSRITAAALRQLAAGVPEQPLRGFGQIVVCAVADEANGIERAVVSVEEWAYAQSGFGEAWIAAVRETVAAARAAVRR